MFDLGQVRNMMDGQTDVWINEYGVAEAFKTACLC